MTYSIIGSGAIGSALARQFARKGIPVAVANRRGPASIAPLVDALGASIVASSIEDAVQADIVILALPFTEVAGLGERSGNWQNRIVVDATNAIDFRDFSPADLGGRFSTEIVRDALPGARVVKAFNTLPAKILESDPEIDGGHRTIFVSSDDGDASKTIAQLAVDLGFAPIALGPIAKGGALQQFGGPLMVHSLIKQG